jgi:hypothetical protein
MYSNIALRWLAFLRFLETPMLDSSSGTCKSRLKFIVMFPSPSSTCQNCCLSYLYTSLVMPSCYARLCTIESVELMPLNDRMINHSHTVPGGDGSGLSQATKRQSFPLHIFSVVNTSEHLSLQ